MQKIQIGKQLAEQLKIGKTQAGRKILSTEQPTQTALSKSDHEQLTYVITQTFLLIKRFYPRVWETSWGSEQETRETQRMMWKQLAKTGVPTQAGLDRLQDMMIERGGDWPPSIPDVIKALQVQPQDLNRPNPEHAWHLAKKNAGDIRKIPDLAVKKAAETISWELKNFTAKEVEKELKPRFYAAYKGIINRIKAGEQLTAVPQLEEKPAELVPPEVIKKRWGEILKKLKQ